MNRTTIMADEQLLEQLRQLAHERRVSMATIIREALEEKVNQTQPKPKSLGIAASGHRDTGRLSSEQRARPRSWR